MSKKKRRRTDFLFTSSSFLMGAGSVLSIAGNYFPVSRGKSGVEADFQALASDWGMVGKDIEDAFEQKDHEEYGKEKVGFRGS